MPAVETFKNVPELFEGIFEESIKTRTETMSKTNSRLLWIGCLYIIILSPYLIVDTFKQLGPDDLVHVVKNIPNSRQQIKEVKLRIVFVCLPFMLYLGFKLSCCYRCWYLILGINCGLHQHFDVFPVVTAKMVTFNPSQSQFYNFR